MVGATAPERLGALRERMPHAVFLLPGVGAQGGRVEDLAPAFAPGPAGGLISASRGIVAAYERTGGDPADAAAREAGRLRELAWPWRREPAALSGAAIRPPVGWKAAMPAGDAVPRALV